MVTALTRLGILIWRGFFTTSLSALHYIPFSMREAFESNLQKAGVSLAARERKAGPTGMAEGLVVLTKPVTPVGGKGPQLKADARSDDPRDIGDEPDNS